MKTIFPLALVAIAFCLTELTLTHFLPLAKTDFDVWLDYFTIKDATYDTMFFMMSLVVFWNTEKISKAISCFMVIVMGGSFIDKVIFDINQYLISDVVLIVGGLIISIYLYFKRWRLISKPG